MTAISYDMFLAQVPARDQACVGQIHDHLLEKGCAVDIKEAKSGYVVSYLLPGGKHTLANFVSRKAGMRMRLYADYAARYEALLDALPAKMKKEIAKASVCRRRLDPAACNPKCAMGYAFHMDGEEYVKCRYMAFMPAVNDENMPAILQILDSELACRA